MAHNGASTPAGFPYPIIWVHGARAFEEWRALRGAGRGYPVIVGGEEDVSRHAEGMDVAVEMAKAPDFISLRARWLAGAHALTHPTALKTARAAERARVQEFLRKSPRDEEALNSVQTQLARLGFGQGETETDEEWTLEEVDPDIGEWPNEANIMEGPSAIFNYDLDAGDFVLRDSVAIILLPTEDWTEAPAFLAFGGWNENPSPDLHVAALRAWRDRYGAELVSMTGDVLELKVTRRPATRQEAIDLALEQHLYCEDNILQGEGEVAPRAAALMASDWWQFWWD